MPVRGWTSHTFAELIRDGRLFVSDGYRAKIAELGGEGPIFLRAGHLTDSQLDLSEVERFQTGLYDRVKSKLARPGDVVVTTKGNSTGRVGYVPAGLPQFVYSPHLSFWRSLDPQAIWPGFLRYWARGREFREQLQGLMASTDMAPYLSLVDQHRLRITLPPPDEQRAIDCILGALDDKIELNRRMNETLEAMARALFKSWFVDFDPVRAKAEGRQLLGMRPDAAALCPDSFEGSVLGKIPKGWRVAPIGRMVRAVGGATPSTEEPRYWDGDIHFATPKDLASLASPVLLETERRITEEGAQRISSGVLPKGTVLLSSRAPIGYLAIAGISVAVNQGFIAMVCDGELPNHYVLHWARENLDTIVGNANGTTFLEISKRNFRPIPVLVPPSGVLAAFAERVDSLYQRIVSNLRESHALTATRDSLLPKLLSGEIRVKDAERFVGAAT